MSGARKTSLSSRSHAQNLQNYSSKDVLQIWVIQFYVLYLISNVFIFLLFLITQLNPAHAKATQPDSTQPDPTHTHQTRPNPTPPNPAQSTQAKFNQTQPNQPITYSGLISPCFALDPYEKQGLIKPE